MMRRDSGLDRDLLFFRKSVDISQVSGHCLLFLFFLLLNVPQLKCAISHSNVKQTVRRRTYDPPWHLSSFLSQMCKHYYPWVILSGVVKIHSISSPPLSTPDTPSKHAKQRG